MAATLLTNCVSDICLGKPPLRSVSLSTTVGEALTVLKRLKEPILSVWSCHCDGNVGRSEIVDDGSCKVECRCVGKVCIGDLICFLAKHDNLKHPAAAFQERLEVVVVNKGFDGLVRDLEPNASLLEAIDLILEGAQNLVIPICDPSTRKKSMNRSLASYTLHNNREYCWVTHEDIVRYLLNSICIFSSVVDLSVESLNIVDTESVLAVHFDDPASSALPLLSRALVRQVSVAVLDSNRRLVGEISPTALNCCDESVAAAIAALSVGDLMAYLDCGDSLDDLVQLIKKRLEERNLYAAMELLEDDSGASLTMSTSSYSSSSDDELALSRNSKLGWHSARVARCTDTVVCHPWNSMVAVMIQALSNRVSYVWVVEEDGTLVGFITFAGMLKVLRERLKSMR